MRRRAVAVAVAGLALAAVALAGCATSVTRTVLLADEDGHVGALAVLNPTTEVEEAELSREGQAARSAGGRPRLGQAVPEAYAALLAGMPRPPVAVVLYFIESTTRLDPESSVAVGRLLELWRAEGRAGSMEIIGHTDSTGSAEANDALSLARAREVQALLADMGFAFTESQVSVVGRGERAPLIPTPDGTPEPRNRRVEVIIR